MAEINIRPWRAEDTPDILRLNAESLLELGAMDAAKFDALRAQAEFVWVALAGGAVRAFIIAFVAGAAYDSLNYQWFSRRLKNFLYVDRITVDKNARADGVGRRIYQAVEAQARADGRDWLAAEINIDPYNAGSIKFHDRHRFIEVGQQTAGGKRVSLRVKSLSLAAPAKPAEPAAPENRR